MNKLKVEYNSLENKPIKITLSNDEVQALRELQNKISEKTSSIEVENHNDIDQVIVEPEISIDRSIFDDDSYNIKVNNAIGQIILGERVINIAPKIGPDHFIEIYSKDKDKYKNLSIYKNQGNADSGDLLFLILFDFLQGVEVVVKKGIRKGYKLVNEELKFIKGHVNVLKTTRNLLSGKLAIDTDYEEFSIDTPLNRLIKSALFVVKNLHIQNTFKKFEYEEIIHKANIMFRHFELIPDYKFSDLKTNVDRNTKYYEQSLIGAKNILRSLGAEVQVGETKASARLMKTADVIESGIRYFLNQNLPEELSCSPTEKPVETLKNKRRPDLLFGNPPIAIGDVKYKVWSKKVDAADINQSIAFAVAAKVNKALIIGFSDKTYNNKINYDMYDDIEITSTSWLIDIDPVESSKKLIGEITKFLKK
jgi:5-methylcytosine-specific restriction endonuclease McrBC regulatory subunit McrC